ncbi:hypothetical protein Mapa_018266 [Marchantia paleacea]|nr:hypothetical protein Mapa_018266 [Marchantia paleacea]
MLISKLVKEMKYNQVVFFLGNVKSIIKISNKLKIKIHSGKIVLPYKKNISSSNFIKIFQKIK